MFSRIFLLKNSLLCLIALLIFACSQKTDFIKDIDGNEYQIIKIGSQWWMATNLKVTHYRNGDPVPFIPEESVWSDVTTGAYCYYDNQKENLETYGTLYNWYAINDERNIAPEGWRVPTDDDWKILESYLGIRDDIDYLNHWRGTNEGAKLKARAGWPYQGDGSNSSGFSAIPGGYRDSSGSFNFLDLNTSFWTSSKTDSALALMRVLFNDYSTILRDEYDQRYGFSVRLIKDDAQ